MAGVLEVTVVAVERSVWAGRATSVIARTVEGDIGILPGHEPVLSLLRDGIVRIQSAEGETILVAASGGFFAVDSNRVSVLAERAVVANENDIDAALRGLIDGSDKGARLQREYEAHLDSAAGKLAQ